MNLPLLVRVVSDSGKSNDGIDILRLRKGPEK